MSGLIADRTLVRTQPDGQRVLIALKPLRAGTRLSDSLWTDRRSYSSFARDADFEYPTSFSTVDLFRCMQNYLNKSNDLLTENNVRFDGRSIHVLKTIEPGEQLTKRYGLSNWLTFLMSDIYGLPLFGSLQLNQFPNAQDRQKAQDNLVKAKHMIDDLYAQSHASELQMGDDTRLIMNSLYTIKK